MKSTPTAKPDRKKKKAMFLSISIFCSPNKRWVGYNIGKTESRFSVRGDQIFWEEAKLVNQLGKSGLGI